MTHTETPDTYEGWANRETWAAHLWATNDRGLYEMCRDLARAESSDLAAGEAVVHYLRELHRPNLNSDVGSWWRVDEAEIGAALRHD